ncbi:MAG: HAD-IIA family hydrolase [Clostridia bacterium]|nr:HAD-IIA family hydrolase [Clostridia bacterium]
MKDYFGRNADGLKTKKLYLFDMDGTIYRENDLFDGVTELLEKIKAEGGRFAFITNNPSKSVKDYIKKLNRLGINGINGDNFFTSAQAAVMIMKEKFRDRLIYAQGTKSFIKELKASGLSVTQKFTTEIAAVLVAFDPEITGKKLRTTCEVLTKLDVPYYATNPDWVCPVDFGSIPDCGSMCVGIEYATGKKPVFIGKPEPTMIFELMKKFKYSKEETVVVGDRLYTDIASGVNAGVDTVCVLSGEATLADIERAGEKDTPTFVLNGVKNFLD